MQNGVIINKENVLHILVPENNTEKVDGLNNIELESDQGMLFDFYEEKINPMTTVLMKYPINMYFLSAQGKIVEKKENVKPGLDIVPSRVSRYVLETKKQYPLSTTFEIVIYPKATNTNLLVLDEKGRIQHTLSGDEKIFSRIHTRQIMSMAKDAEKKKKVKLVITF